jgi:hypothetical protein
VCACGASEEEPYRKNRALTLEFHGDMTESKEHRPIFIPNKKYFPAFAENDGTTNYDPKTRKIFPQKDA